MVDVLPEGIENFLDLLSVGGPVVYLLAMLSVLVMTVSIVKLIQFHRAGVFRKSSARLAAELFRNGNTKAALAQVGKCDGIRSQLVGKSIRGSSCHSSTIASVREEVMRDAAGRLDKLQGYLRILEIIGSLAPLLGLFGTVLGMIDAFQQLENSGNQVDPSILSGGIWLALLTTAAGLAVAMPTVTILSFFERRLERLAHDLDDLVTQIFVKDFDQNSFQVIANAESLHQS